MNSSKSNSFARHLIAFVTGAVALMIPWVCYYIFHDNTRSGDVGMANVIMFLMVTPVVLAVGGTLGMVLLRHFYRTSYFEALKILGVLVWLVFVSCVAGRAAISTRLANLGKASSRNNTPTMVVDVIPSQ